MNNTTGCRLVELLGRQSKLCFTRLDISILDGLENFPHLGTEGGFNAPISQSSLVILTQSFFSTRGIRHSSIV